MAIGQTFKKLAANKWTAISLGVVGAGLLAWYITELLRKKKQDKMAADFYRQIEKIIVPAGSESSSVAFDPYYTSRVQAQNPTKAVNRLRLDTARKIAANIYSKFGYTVLGYAGGDDEAGIFSIFRNEMKSQSQISEVAAAYYQGYGKRLEIHLRERLDETEMRELMKIVNSKPLVTYR